MFVWAPGIALHAKQGNRASSLGEGEVSWNGPRDALIRKKSKFPCKVFMHAHRSYHKMKGSLRSLKRLYRKP